MCFILCDSLQVVSDLQQQQQQQQPEHILVDANMESNNNSSDKDHQQLLQVHQQQHQQQHRLHGMLTRTISQPTQRQVNQPQQQQQQPPVASLVTIIENLNSMNLHRKLERTQSEPLPPQQPMNTSR